MEFSGIILKLISLLVLIQYRPSVVDGSEYFDKLHSYFIGLYKTRLHVVLDGDFNIRLNKMTIYSTPLSTSFSLIDY